MHKVNLTYSLGPRGGDGADLDHPLFHLLDAVHRSGSISAAARELGLSYRHVWGELKRWEGEFGRELVRWSKGQPSVLSPFGEKLLWAERRARARLAPQIEALRSELENAFAVAFDDAVGVVPMHASHDEALPRLRAWCQSEHRLLLDIQFVGSVEALKALDEGRCLVAGFHALAGAPPGSPTARAYRPLLRPGRHKLIGFERRVQGLMLARGNPLRLAGLADLARPGLRFAHRASGTGTRLLLDELLQREGHGAVPQVLRVESSHRAVAAAVASGAADAGFGIESAARAADLDFIALAEEHYFLVTLAAHLGEAPVQTLIAALRSPQWLAALAQLPGHAADRSGEVLSLRRELPWWTYRTPRASATAS